MIIEPINISTKAPEPPPKPKVETGDGSPGRERAEPRTDDAARLAEKVADVQSSLQLNNNVDLNFSVSQGSGDVVVTVRDGSTGKVIREIPPEEMRNFASKIDSMAGLILDRKV